MSIKQTYAVFGLGRYGRAVAKELVDNEVSVTTEERHLLAQEMKRLFTRVALN